jgi:hypothetical protein
MGNKLARVVPEPDYTLIPRELRVIIICYNIYEISDNEHMRSYWGYFKDDPTRESHLLFIPKMRGSYFAYRFRGCFKPYHNITIKIDNNSWVNSV